MDDPVICERIDSHSLLREAKEELASTLRSPAIEAERELIQPERHCRFCADATTRKHKFFCAGLGRVGISIYPEHDTDGEILLKHADVAMYWAKENGRGPSPTDCTKTTNSLLIRHGA